MRQFKVRTLKLADLFAVEKLSLPNLKINQRPESLCMVLALLMSLDQRTHEAGFKNSAAGGAFTEHVFIDHTSKRAAKPRAHRNWKAHLEPGKNRLGQHTLHAL